MLDKGGINSRPNSYRVPDRVQTDGRGFSLCAAPLESFGPGFQDGRNERRSGVYWTGVSEGVIVSGGVEVDSINGE